MELFNRPVDSAGAEQKADGWYTVVFLNGVRCEPCSGPYETQATALQEAIKQLKRRQGSSN